MNIKMSIQVPTARRLLLVLCTCSGVMCAASASAQEHTGGLTIEQIASAPFPSQLRAAPSGESVAWVYNEQGARNVWVAELRGTSYAARRLTVYRDDDGNDINDLVWGADAKTLFYTRGGDNGGTSAVNPLSAPSGAVAGDVWAVSLVGAPPQRLGAGYAPSPSPKGDSLIILRDGQPFLTKPGSATAPQSLFHDEGRVDDVTWSPDGLRIAFVSSRTRHSIIGVFDLAKKQIVWISPGIDHDGEPTWSPDGSRLAFVRFAEDINPPWAIAHPDAYPWEIWIADPATGEGTRRWAAGAGPGSRFRELFNSRRSLFWAADDEIIFPWEVTGWLRLYRISVDRAGDPLLLTPGRAEVFGAELSADRRSLVYSSNLGDIDRRHIWELRLGDGGFARQLSVSRGVEDFPVLSTSGRVLALRAEARVPLRPTLLEGNSMIDLAPEALTADFPTAALVEPQVVTFPASDGLTIHGQLFVPQHQRARGPALLFFHGGPTNRQAFAAWDPFETHSHLYEVNQYLANHGYIVLSVNYRGGAGYGLEFREAQGFGAGGASELNDIIGAAHYLLARPDVDPKRIGVWGGSYGGRMTALALASAPQYFAAGADYAGVHDWLAMPEFVPANDAAAKVAQESSAITHVQDWRAPVLLMHADADQNVPFEQTVELAAALRGRGIAVDYLMIPNEVHFLLRQKSWNEISVATRKFMDRHLTP